MLQPRTPLVNPIAARWAALSAALALAGACALPAHAQQASSAKPEQRGSVYATLGTQGLSLGVIELNGPGDFSARVLLHSGSLAGIKHNDVEFEGSRYDLRQRFGPGVSVLGDWRPWHGTGWRLTGGLVVSRLNTTLAGHSDSAGNFQINGHAYSVAQVGQLQGKLRHKPVSLYVGGGWESKPQGAAGWRFVSDLGLVLMARPSVTLEATNGAGNPALQQDLAAARHDLAKPGAGLVGSVGVAYGF